MPAQASRLSEYFRLMRFLKPHTGILVLAVLCMILASAFDGVSLGMIIPLVDNILTGREIQIPSHAPSWVTGVIQLINQTPRETLLNGLIISMLILFFLKELFGFGHNYLINDASHRVMRDLRNRIYEKLLGLSLDFFHRQKTGVLMARVTNDCGVVQYCFSEGLTDILYQPIQLVVYLVILLGIRDYFSIPWSLVTVLVFLVPMVMYPVLRIGQRLRKISTLSQQKIGEITTTLLDGISGIRIVKVFGTEPLESGRFRRDNERYYNLTMKSVKRVNSISPVTEFISICALAFVLWVGGGQVLRHNLSPGAFIAFLVALLSLIKPFKRVTRVYGMTQQAMAAAGRIFEVLDEVPSVKERANAAKIESFDQAIRFEDVGFSYLPGQPVLKGISFEVKKGEVIAIVGPSGSGKSTLVNLIPRLYDPSQGTLRMDGKDLRDLSPSSLRNKIGMVTQETILFNDTIWANIAYGYPDPTHELIVQAAQTANAHEFIQRLPKGYLTEVGDRGWNLSGGERQRIAIARALLRNPPILILDEATSQLDSESEKLVQAAIEQLMQSRTVFVIAHRLSTVQNANRIIVLDEGRMVEQGTHEELLKLDGVYARLYHLQFREEKSLLYTERR